MSLESAITFFAAILIFSITPGPGIFALIAKSLTEGAKACTLLALGMILSDLIYLVLACYGLATIAEHWEGAFIVIRIAGASYLLYLGYKLWTAPIEFNKEKPQASKHQWFKNLLQGFLISGSNPKVILFYIAFLPTFMDLTILKSNDIMLAAALTFIGLSIGLAIVSIAAAAASNLFESEKAMKKLNKSAGSMMIGAAAFLAIKS